MSGVRIAKTVSSFSLALLAVIALGGTYRELRDKIAAMPDTAAVAKAVSEQQDLLKGDVEIENAIRGIGDQPASPEAVKRLKRLIDLRAQAETDFDSTAPTQAKAIKASPLYRDPGIQDQSNWLDGALKRLADLFHPPKPKAPDLSGMGAAGAIPDLIVPFMWVLLGTAVLVFGYFAVRHFRWKVALRRKARAMLEEDEPERTLDEWLAMANQLSGQGKYREAVRAMYLSCLLKFDEAGVARFIRGETNWEHLGRIQASPKKPEYLDFLPPTRAFDRIWYGFHVQGQDDVDQFRAWYQEITAKLAEAKR